MKNYMRIAIAGLAVALAPIVSNASEALIDFELPSLVPYGNVASAYAGSAGVTFSGETNSNIVTSGDLLAWTAANGTKAYQAASVAGATGFRLDIDVAQSQFDTLQFLYTGQLRLTLIDTADKPQALTLQPLNGWQQTVEFVLDPLDFGLVKAIEFETAGLGVQEFSVDNLQLSLTRSISPLPTPVPEPESFALAGLALLAAGVASRGRR